MNSLTTFFASEAGHNLLSLALILIGIAVCDPSARAQMAHDLVVFGLGVLARSMGSPSTK